MSDSLEETRKAPGTLAEYLRESKESFSVYGWVWRELINDTAKSYMKRMIMILLCANLLSMTLPFLVGYAIDMLYDGFTQRAWFAIVGIGTVLTLGRGVFGYLFMRFREVVLGELLVSLDARTNAMFFEKSLGQHMSQNDELSAANVEKGRARVLELENMMMFEGCEALITLSVAFSFLFLVSWIAGLIMLSAMVLYVATSMFLNQKVADACIPLDREFRRLNRHRVERWEQIERVKTCAKEREEHEYQDRWFKDLINRDRAFWLWFIKMANGRGLMHVCALLGTLSYGVYAVHADVLNIGALVPLFQWSLGISDNMWRIGHIEHRFNWNMPAVRSMKIALTMKPDVVEPDNAHALPKNGPLAVEFKNVSFSYPETNAEKTSLGVLNNVSFDVRPGEVVAVLGKSGAGKSTIMRLLQRGMDPKDGVIRVNGIDVRELNLESLLTQTGYIAQQAAVLDGTLRYNLLYGLPEHERAHYTDDDLWRIMRQLEVDFGERLSDGLDTRVGRRGVKLSGGEAQRVMIASAVIKQPRLMIIDEATSALDSTTEKAVQAGLEEVLKGDMSALIIAHRLSTVRTICDKFVVLRRMDEVVNGNGQVEAIGHSFEELWNISPTFRQLAHDQGIVVNV